MVVLATGVATLLWLGGDPRLALPPVEDMATVTGWRRWSAARAAPDMLVALARGTLLVVAGWLLLVVSSALAARSLGVVRPVAWIERLSPPLARGLVHSVLGLGVAVATLSPPAPARASAAHHAAAQARSADADRAAADGDDTPLLRRLPDPVAPSEAAADRGTGGADTASRHGSRRPAPRPLSPRPPPLPAPGRLPDPPAAAWAPGNAPVTRQRQPAPVGNGGPAANGSSATDRSTWTVTSGDHFWSIAEAVVGGSRVDPTVREVRRYWQELIRVNRDRLVDPSNPDYILPGQQFRLPPTGS